MKSLIITIRGGDEALLRKVEQFAAGLGLEVQFRGPALSKSKGEKASDRLAALDAMDSLAKLKAFKDIENPVLWQREQRNDRSL